MRSSTLSSRIRSFVETTKLPTRAVVQILFLSRALGELLSLALRICCVRKTLLQVPPALLRGLPRTFRRASPQFSPRKAPPVLPQNLLPKAQLLAQPAHPPNHPPLAQLSAQLVAQLVAQQPPQQPPQQRNQLTCRLK